MKTLTNEKNESKISQIEETKYNREIIQKIIEFLQLFVCETLAKRLVSMVLIAVGIPNNQVTFLTGVCDRSVRTLKKELTSSDNDKLFHVGGGGGRGKLADIESAIIEEITQNDYHSRQQIADMVLEKYGIKVSRDSIRRLLKKTISNV
jgi:transposase